uniref:Uncharacterized protein n=1 Tax=Entomoneis paludosa TaxID=265537 RepID=A0A7S2YQC8_9STRA|mmetsp:Transcript_5130/g.10855  ORF Transcript_5130/g.10855 Transcript_5130/m.10855 type:complete len:404 (+) Transcript_5130:48-1259(+)
MRKFNFRRKSKGKGDGKEKAKNREGPLAKKQQQEEHQKQKEQQQPIASGSKSYDDANSEAGKSFISVSRLTEKQRKYLDEDQELYDIMKKIQASGSGRGANFDDRAFSPTESALSQESGFDEKPGSPDNSSRGLGWRKRSMFARKSPERNNMFESRKDRVASTASPTAMLSSKWLFSSRKDRARSVLGKPKSEISDLPLAAADMMIHVISESSKDGKTNRLLPSNADIDADNSEDAIFYGEQNRSRSMRSSAHPMMFRARSSIDRERDALRMTSLFSDVSDGEDTEADIELIRDVAVGRYARSRSLDGESSSSAAGNRSSTGEYTVETKSTSHGDSTITDSTIEDEEDGHECFFSVHDSLRTVLFVLQGNPPDAAIDKKSRRKRSTECEDILDTAETRCSVVV